MKFYLEGNHFEADVFEDYQEQIAARKQRSKFGSNDRQVSVWIM